MFQRPDKRAIEQGPEAERVWLEETWPAIREGEGRGRRGLFADQVGIRSDPVSGRTPIVRRTGNRISVNAMSAISTKGRMHLMVFTESFDANVMCRFLDRLAGHFDRKIHLVVDRHSAHRSPTVRDWLADHADQVELHFLPSYSSELNPDELVKATSNGAFPRAAKPVPRPNSPARHDGSSTAVSPAHRPRLLPRPARPLHPRREPFEFLTNRGGSRTLRGGFS
ncbi:transposase [Streptomyces sp. NPDC058434]|uniref:transposase n=1 Tax=Streptomyces sp. NPDC058434 TaxID=3346498 RepID=UPI00364F7694